MEDKIKFPFQYLEKYLLGETSLEAACDSTIEECNRLIEEYIEKHKDRDCDNCKHSYEDETLDGYWQLYCINKLDNKEGSAVFPYDCCDKFESKHLKINF